MTPETVDAVKVGSTMLMWVPVARNRAREVLVDCVRELARDRADLSLLPDQIPTWEDRTDAAMKAVFGAAYGTDVVAVRAEQFLALLAVVRAAEKMDDIAMVAIGCDYCTVEVKLRKVVHEDGCPHDALHTSLDALAQALTPKADKE
jgi:hypothetical protein